MAIFWIKFVKRVERKNENQCYQHLLVFRCISSYSVNVGLKTKKITNVN